MRESQRESRGDGAAIRCRERVSARSRYGRFERVMARLTLLCFIAAPIHAETTDTRALGSVHHADGTGRFTVDTDVHTQYDQSVRAGILDFARDIQQPASHTLEFVQQSGESVLLRMPGVMPANFMGSLIAAGEVVIANPAGIFFQDGSFIDVGSLIATGSSMTNDQFFNREGALLDLTGPVVNAGTIRAGDVLMTGVEVANFGSIQVRDGSLMMLAGDQIMLREHGSPILISSSLPGSSSGRSSDEIGAMFGDDPAVENAGEIDAGRGSVRLAAGDMLSFAVRNSGRIKANEISLEGGAEGLVEVSGRLDAGSSEPGTKGGAIEVLGDYVAVIDEAELDASGPAGGGTIHVGGERSGGGETRTARSTYLAEGTSLKADALEDGDGGEVIVWADENAYVYGDIAARGGIEGGDGGFVETSGKRFLDLGSRPPDVRARGNSAQDRGGEWLLDPLNVTIVGNAQSDPDEPDYGVDDCTGSTADGCLDDQLVERDSWNPELQFSPDVQPVVADSEISANLLEATLNRGSTVTITTEVSGGQTGDQVGDITIAAPIIVRDNPGQTRPLRSSLNLLAANDIIVKEEIRNDNPNLELDLDFRANDAPSEVDPDGGQPQDRDVAGELAQIYLGDIEIKADIFTGGGDVDLNGVNIDIASGSEVATGGGEVRAKAFGGDLTIDGAIDTSQAGSDSDSNLRGGLIGLAAVTQRHAIASDSSEEALFGGNIDVQGNVTSEGGDIFLISGDLAGDGTLNPITNERWVSGEIDISGTLDSRDHSGGEDDGLIEIISTFGTFGTETQPPQEDEIFREGIVKIGRRGVLRTGGGGVSLRGVNIIVLGDVSTINTDENGSDERDSRGGDVLLTPDSNLLVGFNGEVVIEDLRTADALPQIRTDGGNFQSAASIGGSFSLRNSTIDTQTDSGSESVSTILIESVRPIQIQASGGRKTALKADGLVSVASLGDIVFVGNATKDIVVSGSRVVISAGDVPVGIPVDAGPNVAVLGLDEVEFSGASEEGLEAFELFQHASIDLEETPLEITERSDQLVITLTSDEGDIAIGSPGEVANSELNLIAATGVAGPAGLSLKSLSIQITEDIDTEDGFIVDDDLSAMVGVNIPEVSILTAGKMTVVASLTATASTEADADPSKLSLHAGGDGSGDLAFGTDDQTIPVELTAEDLTLRAGSGLLGGESKVLAAERIDDTNARVNFVDTETFTLRQDAEIVIQEGDIPERGQFKGPAPPTPDTDRVDGLNYTLRSDSNGIDATEPSQYDLLDGSNLSLHALGNIRFPDVPDDGIDTDDPNTDPRLTVRSLDIGGLASFEYTYAMNEWTHIVPGPDDPTRRRTIRSGIAQPGNLTFGEHFDEIGGEQINDFYVVADEIRLVAGDGVGGITTSTINCDFAGGACPIFVKTAPDQTSDPTPLDTFVFRQDGSIGDGSIPIFEQDITPAIYLIQSDDRSINFSDYSDTSARLPNATEKLILAAPRVELARSDGLDLVVSDEFQLVPTDDTMQIRADVFDLSARNATPSTSKPQVIPGSADTLLIYGFTEESTDGSGTSPGLVPDPASTTSVDATPAEIIVEQVLTINADLEDGSDLGDIINSIDLSSQVYAPDPIVPAGDETPDPSVITYKLISEDETWIDSDLIIRYSAQAGAVHPILISDLELQAKNGINFVTDSGSDLDKYVVSSLFATVETGWRITDYFEIETYDSAVSNGLLELRAGTGSEGDLSFGDNVTLVAEAIKLVANQSSSTDDDAKLSVVNAWKETDSPQFIIDDNPDNLRSSTSFEIDQSGSLVDFDPGVASGISRIPDATQIDVPDDDGIIGSVTFSSRLGDITITDPEAFPTKSNQLSLQIGNITKVLTIGSETLDTDTNLNTLVTEDGTLLFEAPTIDLIAGPGKLVKAAGDNFTFTTLEFRIQYNGNDIDEGTGCEDGCLPLPDQFNSNLGGIAAVDYTLEAVGGSVWLNDAVAQRVETTNLILQATPLAGRPGVYINANSALSDNRLIDIYLNSLKIRPEDGTVDITIFNEQAENSNASTPNTDSVVRLYTQGEITPSNDPTAVGTSQLYFGDITLGRSVEESVEFETTGEILRFAGNIRLFDDATSGRIQLNTKNQVRLEGDVDIAAAANAELDVLADSDSGLLVTFETRTELEPNVHFLANTTTDSSNDPPATQSIRAGSIGFFGVQDLAGIDFFGQPRPGIDALGAVDVRRPTSATIFKQSGDQNLTFVANQLVANEGERISTTGDLIFETSDAPGIAGAGSRVGFGDLNAINIAATSDRVELYRRDAGRYLDSDGELHQDVGVDYVANTILFDTPTLITLGDGNSPTFALKQPMRSPANLEDYSVAAFRADGSALQASDLESGFTLTLLDLHPEGPSRDDISTVYVETAPIPTAWLPDSWLPTDKAKLRDLGIDTRPTTRSEYRSRLAHAFIIDDVGGDLLSASGSTIEVSEARILTDDATPALKRYTRVFGVDDSRTTEVRGILQGALDRYRASSGARRVLGFELRRYVRNRPSTEFDAYQVLEDLDALFRHHRRIGLSPGEYKPIQYRWLESIQPDGISIDELSEAVQPSRFIRGSDILDIFGD